MRLTQNPAGFCWQWMQSWMMCGSRRGMVIMRRREVVVVGAGLFRPTARLTPAATYWMNRPARPPLPGRLTRLGFLAVGLA